MLPNSCKSNTWWCITASTSHLKSFTCTILNLQTTLLRLQLSGLIPPPSSCWIFNPQSRDRVSRAVHTICLLSLVCEVRSKITGQLRLSQTASRGNRLKQERRLVFQPASHVRAVMLPWSSWRAAEGQFVLKTKMLNFHLRFSPGSDCFLSADVAATAGHLLPRLVLRQEANLKKSYEGHVVTVTSFHPSIHPSPEPTLSCSALLLLSSKNPVYIKCLF